MITVRTAKTGECDDVVAFYCELIESMRGSEFKPEWEMGVYPTREFLQDAIDEQALYLAYLDDRLVGVMILNNECAPGYDNVGWRIRAEKHEVVVIHALGVSSAFQRRGLAKEMVSYAIDLAGKGSAKAIRLDVLKNNIPASRLYESMDFQFIDSIKMYYEDTGLTDFLLYEFVL